MFDRCSIPVSANTTRWWTLCASPKHTLFKRGMIMFRIPSELELWDLRCLTLETKFSRLSECWCVVFSCFDVWVLWAWIPLYLLAPGAAVPGASQPPPRLGGGAGTGRSESAHQNSHTLILLYRFLDATRHVCWCFWPRFRPQCSSPFAECGDVELWVNAPGLATFCPEKPKYWDVFMSNTEAPPRNERVNNTKLLIRQIYLFFPEKIKK